jgi:hypothetical protein
LNLAARLRSYLRRSRDGRQGDGHIDACRWEEEFQNAHPCLRESPAETDKLRLVLGIGRSGTSWISTVLSKAACPTRFLSEPLTHLRPRLPLRASGDRTALSYDGTVSGPLLRAYELVAHRGFNDTSIHGFERNDPDWQICLVKEVHALLGSDALLRTLHVPTLFISRDPVWIIDSLFAAQSPKTLYLDHEVRAVQEPRFLERFGGGLDARVAQAMALHSPRRLVLQKAVCVKLLQVMFSRLAQELPNVMAVDYERFCEQPLASFQAAARFLGIPWDEGMERFLASTRQGSHADASNPYSIVRDTSAQGSREFKYLSTKEVELCRAALSAVSA